MVTRNRVRMVCAVTVVIGLFFMGNCAGVSGETPGEGGPISSKLPENRPFYMGFTTWSMGDSQSIPDERLYKTLAEHGDMITLHSVDNPVGGIPWREALAEKPYPDELEETIAGLKSRLRADQKLYLALNPLNLGRNALKQKPDGWKDKDFDDPDIIAAYTNFCRRMIREFNPDYMAYGVEVNMLAISNPAGFPKFLVMAKEVYKTLKKENPGLPIFLTFQIDHYYKLEENQREALHQLLPYTDYMAVSCYPYMEGYADPESLPTDWFSKVAELAPSKPFAIAETGYTAEDVVLKKVPPFLPKDVHVPGSEEWQASYTRFILEEANKLNGRFVVWFFAHDFDAYFDQFEGRETGFWEFAKWWKDNGMVDGDGNPRESLRIWDEWLKLPVTRPPEN